MHDPFTLDVQHMDILKIAAFSDGNFGGNPAGVVLCDALPTSAVMQQVAADVGFSETAFAERESDGFRVRYFSPEAEVPFCGHATIALGAALVQKHGDGRFALRLSNSDITVEGRQDGDLVVAALQSPPTRSAPVEPAAVREALALFGYSESNLDLRIPPARIHAGADHLVLMLRSRAALRAMHYDLAAGRSLMTREAWVTILLGHIESDSHFDTRNAFAYGGVPEDPATGASTAALAGYLRDLKWPHGGRIEIVQGEDMGVRSLLRAEFSDVPGSSVRVSGTARTMQA
jgi:PhzF family phenazine biosynthesis protein